MSESTSLYDNTYALSTVPRFADDGDPSPARVGTPAEACPDAAISELLQYLGRAVPCFVAGALLMEEGYGKVILVCLRPVDAFFLQAVQQRMLRSYRLCAGPAQAIHRLDVTVHGEPVCGPYEPPRSFLSLPILAADGRALGALSIASVFPEVFDSEDVCTLSIVAAQVAAVLDRLHPAAGDRDGGMHRSSQADERRRRLHHRYRVDRYLSSILGTVALWNAQDDVEVADALRRDLETIARDVIHLRALLSRLHAD